MVYCREGEVRGWLRLDTSAGKGLFEIMLHPAEEVNLGAITDFCIKQLSACNTILSLVSTFQSGLQRVLSDRGFWVAAEYRNLIKELASKVVQPSLAPAQI